MGILIILRVALKALVKVGDQIPTEGQTQEAMKKANELLEYINDRDEETERSVDTAEMVQQICDRFKGRVRDPA